jgi:hypothetical protein
VSNLTHYFFRGNKYADQIFGLLLHFSKYSPKKTIARGIKHQKSKILIKQTKYLGFFCIRKCPSKIITQWAKFAQSGHPAMPEWERGRGVG